jgi:hypothetical protein
MAGQYLSVGEVVDTAIYRADLEGITDRHPLLDLIFEANLSYRDLRVKLANADVQTVLTATAITALPVVEAIAGGGYAEIDWPVDAVSVHGLDVKVGGYWCTVPQGSFAQRRLGPAFNERGDFQYAGEGLAQWIQRSLPTTSGSTQVAGKIMLFPVPTGGSYVLWYLPQWVDLTLVTDLFPGQESWLQWVICDLAVKALVRDVGPQPTQQLIELKEARERSWMEIRTNTQRLAQDGPIEVQSRYGSGRGRGARLIP